jgi:hypothetical protein
LVLDRALQVTVKTITGKSISLDAEASDGIDALKYKLDACHGVPVEGTVLALQMDEDGTPLKDFNLKHKSTLHLVELMDIDISGPQQIFVKTPSGKTLAIDAEAEDTIAMLKTEIYVNEGIPPDQQRLTLEPPDSSTLANIILYGTAVRCHQIHGISMNSLSRSSAPQLRAEEESAHLADAEEIGSGSVAAVSGAMPMTPMSIEEQEQELRQWLRNHGSVAFAEAQAQRARNAGSGAGI